MGGLEPPTSASQTRRAGRLRYTPADKSIIRSMPKRQDPAIKKISHPNWLICCLGLVIFMTACQPPTQAPVPSETLSLAKTATIDPVQPSEIPTASPTPKPTATLSPTKTEDCLSLGGELRTSSLTSELLAEDLSFHIYLPPCYQEDTQYDYPVVYLLHGLTYTNEQWLSLGLVETMDRLVAQGEIPPTIIVLPWEKRFISPQTSKYGEALALELVDWIDDQYRTVKKKFYRAIGGVSRGASWAVRIGFDHPDLFSRIGAHSLPTFNDDIQQVQTWATQISSKRFPITLIDIGRSDQEVQSALDFANQLDQYNIPHEFYLFNGGHTEEYWTSHFDFYLGWYTQDW